MDFSFLFKWTRLLTILTGVLYLYVESFMTVITSMNSFKFLTLRKKAENETQNEREEIVKDSSY